MNKPTVDVLVVQFAYGGNGGVSSTIPELAQWMVKTVIEMKADPRIGRIGNEILSDTPVTLTRNRSIRIAKESGFDMILMLDSDNLPDQYLAVDPTATPFWSTAFNFAYDRLLEGKPTCIAAPYCGPPPHPVERPGMIDGGEVPYLFQWADNESDTPTPQHKLEMYTRTEAAKLSGIYPMAALPTGVCLFTTSCFDGMSVPYFFYEFNEDHSEKHSTEDVVATRNISLHWAIKKGWDVCFAACDSWALHYKPKKVGKPRVTPVEVMAKKFRESLEEGFSVRERKVMVDYAKDLPRKGQILRHDQDQVYLTDEDLAEAEILIKREQEAAGAPELPEPTKLPASEEIAQKAFGERKDEPTEGRIIYGRKIAIIGKPLEDKSLEGARALVSYLLTHNDKSPLEVAVLHCNTGQVAAAILPELPNNSHLYAIDSLSAYRFKTEAAKNFSLSFGPEIESGRVMADIDSRRLPEPTSRQHLDMVFIERFVTFDKLATWAKHVRPGGVLAGCGYESPAIKKAVDKFTEENAFEFRSFGDVWAVSAGSEDGD